MWGRGHLARGKVPSNAVAVECGGEGRRFSIGAASTHVFEDMRTGVANLIDDQLDHAGRRTRYPKAAAVPPHSKAASPLS
jgi:hypothetical protein